MNHKPRTPASADIVVGLGWGDEGKGATTDFLVAHRNAERVVRFNGGQQAAHNVIVDGRHHTFASYGSGTFSGISTWISKYCTIDPIAAKEEAMVLESKGILTEFTKLLRVHEDALVTTPLHVWVNQWRESSRGDARHGSTGTGFGETVGWEYEGRNPLRAKDLADEDKILSFLDTYAEAHEITINTNNNFRPMATYLHRRAQEVLKVVSEDHFLTRISSGHTVFEGAQGFMLDENHGTAPHTTWSTTTPDNARTLCEAAGIKDVTSWGAIRTYATRHGHGPLPGEGIVAVPEPHNRTTEWAGAFRTGAWESSVLEKAIEVTGVDKLSISWADMFDGIVTTEGVVPWNAFAPVGLLAKGPQRTDREIVS